MSNQIRPSGIRLEASSHCQLRCPSCPTTTGAINPAIGGGFLKFSDFKELLDKNPWIRRVELSNYGEVLLNPELLKMMEYAFSRHITLTAGNGVNLNHAKEEVLEGLVKYRMKDLTVSIDGASQETYQIYRVRGKFDEVIGHIKKINEYKQKYNSELPRLAWQFIVFGHNEHEIPKARKMAAELHMKFNLKLTWDNNFSPIKDIEYVRKEIGVGAVTREEFTEKWGVNYQQRICHQLWNLPQINWDGKVLGCCRNFWGDFGANAFKDGLLPAVNSEKMQYAREMLTGSMPEREDIPCTTCEIYLDMKAKNHWLKKYSHHPVYRRLENTMIRLRALVSPRA
jgi:MoaA/NifB/PqqE/SkfB family radical SAM enzyme